jgi:hypothetical protein
MVPKVKSWYWSIAIWNVFLRRGKIKNFRDFSLFLGSEVKSHSMYIGLNPAIPYS